MSAKTAPDQPKVPARRLFALLWPYRLRLLAAGLLLLVSTGTNLAFPLAVRQIVDSAFVAADPAGIGRVALFLVGLFTVGAAANYSQNYLSSYTGERLVMDLRTRLAGHVLRLSMRFFDTRKTGDITSIFGNDVGMVRQGVMDTSLQLVPQLVRLVGSVAVVLFLNWRLTLVVGVVGPLAAGLTVVVGRRIREVTGKSLEELGRANAVLNEALSSPRVVKAFGRESDESRRYTDHIRAAFRAVMRRAVAQAALWPTNEFLFNMAIVVVLWFGAREVLAGRLTPGQLIAFLIYFGQISNPISQMSRMYTNLQQALAAGGRVFGLLAEDPVVADKPGAVPCRAPLGRVVFDSVAFRYDPERPALEDVSFVAEPGQTVALVGPSGAGKTTVVALLLRLYDVTGGAITLDGQDLRDVTQESLRAHMELVPQEPVLFGISVAENIRYGRLDAGAEEVETAARAANAHDFVTALPQGYETEVGERGVQLSVGQRQRIAIARAILRDPRVLLLDEATASLDNESEYLVQEALNRLMAARTTLVVAHRLTTVERAHRIVVLDAGRVVESGPPAELMAAGGLYHRLATRAFAEVPA